MYLTLRVFAIFIAVAAIHSISLCVRAFVMGRPVPGGLPSDADVQWLLFGLVVYALIHVAWYINWGRSEVHGGHLVIFLVLVILAGIMTMAAAIVLPISETREEELVAAGFGWAVIAVAEWGGVRQRLARIRGFRVAEALATKDLPAIINALRDPHWFVRWRAAETLIEFGAAGEPALEDLLCAINDKCRRVRESAAAALQVITKLTTGSSDASTECCPNN